MNKVFEVGNTYKCSSPCQSDCVWTFEVVHRTAKTVKLNDGTICRTKLDENGNEYIYPLGKYSLAPILRA